MQEFGVIAKYAHQITVILLKSVNYYDKFKAKHGRFYCYSAEDVYMASEPEKWSSLEEIAKHLGVSKDTIRNWIKKGVIPYRRIGKQYKFRISEVDAWVDSGKSAIIE